MDMIASGYRGFTVLLGVMLDRLVIPLAVIVGLAGGAMIGAELARIQTHPADTIH